LQSTGAEVVICETHANNPAVAQFAADLSGDFVAATITGQGAAPLADMVLQQIRMARAAGLVSRSIVHAGAQGPMAIATLQATWGDVPLLLRLTAVCTQAGAAHHRLLAHGRVDSACLQVWSDPAPRPALASHITPASTTNQPTVYEGAHRATLRGLVAGDATPPGGQGLREWMEDAELALGILA
jgi:hypothetical protein